MRLSIFSEGDRVLLLGEGNFSFARNLFDHNLPIEITATCFDDGTRYRDEEENVNYLRENGVTVLVGVDATNVHNHSRLKNERYTKIIFNFPHVGGKMKIQLNRELIRRACESSSRLLQHGDAMILSLCKGQGGTPADDPPRKWSDSWQITEMVAHGDLCLTSVEPFRFDDFPRYVCTGYRSQDSNFNSNGALVHIFKKRIFPAVRTLSDDAALLRLSLVPIRSDSDVLVPFSCCELYRKNPLENPRSIASFFKKILLAPDVSLVPEEDVSICVKDCGLGVACRLRSSGEERRLRRRATQILDELTPKSEPDATMLFPGVYFDDDDDSFRTPLVRHEFLLVGKSAATHFRRFLAALRSAFAEDVTAEGRDGEWTCSAGDRARIVAREMNSAEAVVIYVQPLSEVCFGVTDWREAWSRDGFVSDSAVFRPPCLYPPSFAFDVTLKYATRDGLSEADVRRILRTSAADLIADVELVDAYRSREDWSSKCFRITYRSAEEAMHRERVVDIHARLIGRILATKLSVAIK